MLSLLLQFAFVALAAAAPITTESHGNAWQYGAGGGVLGFIVLILDIIVFCKLPFYFSLFISSFILSTSHPLDASYMLFAENMLTFQKWRSSSQTDQSATSCCGVSWSSCSRSSDLSSTTSSPTARRIWLEVESTRLFRRCPITVQQHESAWRGAGVAIYRRCVD